MSKEEEWDAKELHANGVDLLVVTNGSIVRIMSLDHIYIEVPLVIDNNYEYDDGIKFSDIIEFITKGEMNI